ncbi:homoserine O-acetyltransferase [soil metagenome]
MAKQEIVTQYAKIASPEKPFRFSDGRKLDDLTIAYETYGTLNEHADNAVLVFHALSGSMHAAGINSVGPGSPYWTEEMHDGWWDGFIGPNRAINTKRFFVICANTPGGCYGSTGPSSEDPLTGKPYGSSFPYPSISDVVDANMRLLDQLGIKTLLAVAGGSMGGFCVLDLAVRYHDRVNCVIPIATGARATVLSKALNFEQIYAIEEDRNFRGGDYYGSAPPHSGLTLARMISHKTFVSLSLMESRARKAIVQPEDVLSGYKLQHQIESYILHQGKKFVKRFDANTYLRIISAWQNFDLAAQNGDGDVSKALKVCKDQEWVLFSINSDVCFFPEEQAEIAAALKSHRIDYQHITVHSDKGHDSFLLEPELYTPYISFKLGAVHDQIQDHYSI